MLGMINVNKRRPGRGIRSFCVLQGGAITILTKTVKEDLPKDMVWEVYYDVL